MKINSHIKAGLRSREFRRTFHFSLDVLKVGEKLKNGNCHFHLRLLGASGNPPLVGDSLHPDVPVQDPAFEPFWRTVIPIGLVIITKRLIS